MSFKIGIDIDITFEGDYISPEDAEYYLSDWIYGGLDDREDIAEIKMIFGPPRETG